MKSRAIALAFAAALYASAVATADGAPQRPPADWAASLARPFVLPPLWRQLADAAQRADPAEAIAAGRTITRLLPDWTDGAVHVAWICALELSRESRSADLAVDRITTALGWLEESARLRLARDPGGAADLLGAAATLVESRTTLDPALAAAFRARVGRDPAAVGHALLDRALAIDPRPFRAERRAFATARIACGAIRMGDLRRAEATLRTAIAQLEAVDDDEARATATSLRSLRPLGTYLRDDGARRALLDDPRTAELARALEGLTDG